MLQKTQKPLLKGVSGVARTFDDYMKAEKGKKSFPTMEAVMQIV